MDSADLSLVLFFLCFIVFFCLIRQFVLEVWLKAPSLCTYTLCTIGSLEIKILFFPFGHLLFFIQLNPLENKLFMYFA